MNPEEIVEVAEETREKEKSYKHCLCVCSAAGCASSNSLEIRDALQNEVEKQNLGDVCQVKGVGCLGLCAEGPLVYEKNEGYLYRKVTLDDVSEIVQGVGKKPVERLTCATDIPFFQRQTRVVLENFWKIDPEEIEDYIAADGYEGMIQAVTEMTPEEVIHEIHKSGLRGRGGAGYPTGLKWSTVAKAMGEIKYVVCNADEGDPGAFMDRSILESDPHRILEGMAIAAYATGASQGYIYVRAEYPLAIKRLRNAIKQAEKMDLLGKNICGTTFHFHLEVRLGAGAFVCGEETALIASIEGLRGTPRPRPPYPAEYGLRGHPTLINNVETFANVPSIIRQGADWFASMGTEKSKGTKVFALAGQINNTGLIEVPMGITLREIVYDIGGGVPEGRSFKAVQTGGPSGGCIPEEYLDLPVDYESLSKVGSIMGSGGMIVMDETSNMVEVAQYFMEFCLTESCGKCVPCRVGTHHMYTLLGKILDGKATQKDLDLLEELCQMVCETSLCGLGQTAPNPVMSTLRFFREEYESLLKPIASAASS